MGKYAAPVRILGGSALIALIIALVFPVIRDGISDERTRNGVLMQAVPFFAVFAAILLLYILLGYIIAYRFNGKVPNRTYKGVENTLVIGILVGVVLLFQPIDFVGYRYGFLLVLASLLAFILWSHVVGRIRRADLELSRFTTGQQIAGGVAFVVIAALLSGVILQANAPREPFGVRERVWNTYDEAEKAVVRDQALATFSNVEVPFVILFSLVPAALFFFIVREVVASLGRESQTASSPLTPQRSSA
jgi:uncharacterized membrane protein